MANRWERVCTLTFSEMFLLHTIYHAGPVCRSTLLKMEEEWIQRTCEQIAAFKPDLVITGALARLAAAADSSLLLPLEHCWPACRFAMTMHAELPSVESLGKAPVRLLRSLCRKGCERPGRPLPHEGRHRRHPPRAQD
jgi:hypothetical protein